MLLNEFRPLRRVDKDLKMFDMQFYFPNKHCMPTNSLRRKEPEKLTKTKKRSKRNTGCEIMSSQMAGSWYYVSVSQLVKDLWKWGYKLVDGFYQERPSKRSGHYYIVRFTFARHEIAKEYYPTDSLVAKALKQIMNYSCWRLKLYLNPYYDNGEEVEGNYSMSAKLLNGTRNTEPTFDLVAQGYKVRQVVS